MSENTNIVIRNFDPKADSDFIYSTFLRANKHGNDYNEWTADTAFFAEYKHRLEGLLGRPGVQTIVACLEEDPNVILAWAMAEPEIGVFHFVFTKDRWRKQGIARTLTALLAGTPEAAKSRLAFKVYTHVTRLGRDLGNKKGWTFNPLLHRLY